MIAFTPRRLLIAALALIVVTNAFVLAGVAYNRSGEARATLRMSERELSLPFERGLEGEKSGIALSLEWRTLPTRQERARQGRYGYYQGSGVVDWLDAAKLAGLGFDRAALEDPARSERRQRQKEVLLVLELAGPAYEEAVAAARAYLTEKEAEQSRAPESKKAAEDAKEARQWLERELRSSSRLFVVDAGLDEEALRGRYPDRGRYAVVAGRVRPWVEQRDGVRRVLGYVSAVSVGGINVPLEHRPVFERLSPTLRYSQGVHLPRFEATIAYGRRLEPWVTAATRLPATR